MRLILVFLLSILSAHTQAQHPFLSRFTASNASNGVFLEWTLTAGNTCQGISIERAAVGEEFEEIGNIEGVCGSADRDEEYSFLDEEPLIGEESRYRLLLGASGYTDEVSIVFFDFDSNGYVMLHDSRAGIVTLVSSGATGNTMRLINIYASDGTLLREVSLTSNMMEVSLSDFSSGAYSLVVLESSEVKFSSRFVKTD